MYCKNCGQQIDEKSIYCPYCGANIATGNNACVNDAPSPGFAILGFLSLSLG